MSELSDAFQELQDAKAEVLGKYEYVLLNGRKVLGLVSEITSMDIFVSGGEAQSGGFTVSVAQSILAKAPDKFTPIEVRGNKLQVMDANDRNGVTWEITAGDPAAGT